MSAGAAVTARQTLFANDEAHGGQGGYGGDGGDGGELGSPGCGYTGCASCGAGGRGGDAGAGGPGGEGDGGAIYTAGRLVLDHATFSSDLASSKGGDGGAGGRGNAHYTTTPAGCSFNPPPSLIAPDGAMGAGGTGGSARGGAIYTTRDLSGCVTFDHNSAKSLGGDGGWRGPYVGYQGPPTGPFGATGRPGVQQGADIFGATTSSCNTTPPTAQLAGAPSTSASSVTDSVQCASSSSSACKTTESLTTTTGNSTSPMATSAKPKVHTVVVGTRSVTILPGKTVKVTVKLNKAGRKLLKRYHKLHVTLTIALVSGGKKHTVATRKLVIKHKK